MPSVENMEELKNKGNAAFASKNFSEAIGFFSQAINLAPDNHILYSNRSACYSSNQEYEKALVDADKCVGLKSDFAKGYGRKGAALQGLGKIHEAIQAFEDGLKVDPVNAALKKGLEECQAHQSMDMDEDNDFGMGMGGAGGNPMLQLAAMFQSPQVWSTIATSPRLAAYKNDPSFIAKIKAIQANPSSMSSHMDHPGVMALLSEFIGLPMGGGPGMYEESSSSNKTPTAEKSQQKPEPMEVEEEEDETEESMKKKQALVEKDKGNAAYKNKDFDTALRHYQSAIDLDPETCTFYSNISAVEFERGDYVKCREMCLKAIEVGQKNFADFSIIAKVMNRVGNSYVKEDNLEEAIVWFNKSLTEHRTKETLENLNKTERILKQRKVEEYIDHDKASEEKNKAAELFKEGKYPEAVDRYSEAMRRNPTDHTLYSNRAWAYMKLGSYPSAIKDCEECLKRQPTFVKAWVRKAQCYQIMKEYDLCFKAWTEVKKIEPTNVEAEMGMQRAAISQQMELQRRQQEEQDKRNK